MAILAAAYFLTARLGAILASISVVSAIWPAAGVGLGGLLILGTWAWPAIAIGGFLESVTNVINGAPPVVAAAVAAGQTLALFAAALLLRAARFDHALTKLRDVFALVVAAVVSSLLAASVGPPVLMFGGFFPAADLPLASFVWWVGDVLGVLTATPLVLLLRPPRPSAAASKRRAAEAAPLLVATFIASALLFRSSLPLVFLTFPFALWAALRLGIPGAAAANLLITAVSVWTTVKGHGPFAQLPSTLRLVSLQTFNASIAITSLVLAAAMKERARALEDVRESRARLVEAADTERRRLERDLHDGAQQRLVSLSYTLGLLLARLDPSVNRELRDELTDVLAELTAAHGQLRAFAQGVHPAVLTQHGLALALESLAEQASVPVTVAAPAGRYPPVVEATAYFVVAEALTNVAKHSRATQASVALRRHHDRLVVEVVDDGIGDADPARGSGLTGLSDRAAALGGQVAIDSPPGCGTRLRTELPCAWS